ncbi:dynamin family protein [Dictyobacter aurantiacus]|uniref:Dynamin n=1 Tax=Dictyobacter aurantiacus TaxID=1936993 RepID=A0A401ZB34_9CHLR|nr:dynamin family protein [Dictyobacter aurantiacus]GCE04100.1 dynamin [Dictyobacter aurantiacus]
MAKSILQERQRALLQQEKQLAIDLASCLENFEGGEPYEKTLRQVTASLDDLFLLVIVGEFNAGKSACINALLHDEVLEEGVIPTTHQVTILRHGEERSQHMLAQDILEMEYPAEFLRDISIVDTPGVNAILQEHQRLTEEFVPRSDLILFVTSTDRPFTQSEKTFMERIRAWGKKVIIILNKIDLLRSPEELQKITTFISHNCQQLLGFQAEIFPVSALQAQQARQAVGHQAVELWERSRFGRLEEYLFETLDARERVRLKLLSPLGVMQRLLDQTRGSVEERARLLTEDARTVTNIENQLSFYREDMERNFKHRLTEIANIVLEMRQRGDYFFDDTIRLRRILDLVQGDRIRREFEREVLGDSAARIEHAVQEMIDWMVEQEHHFWQNVMEYIDRRREVSLRRDDNMIGAVSRQFDYNRRLLLQSVSHTVTGVIQTYDQEAESTQLAEDMRNTVAQAVITGAGGIGLGALIVAFMGTLAADVTGIIAGIGLLLVGYGIIPLRRKQAKKTFDEKMQELQQRLTSAMSEQFRKELQNSLNRIEDAIAPYTRFVRSEQQKTTEIQARISQLNNTITTIKNEIEKG